eukprot:SAG11_NODE_35669_length_265_cov_1.228916_1_plen_58_part_01
MVYVNVCYFEPYALTGRHTAAEPHSGPGTASCSVPPAGTRTATGLSGKSPLSRGRAWS